MELALFFLFFVLGLLAIVYQNNIRRHLGDDPK